MHHGCLKPPCIPSNRNSSLRKLLTQDTPTQTPQSTSPPAHNPPSFSRLPKQPSQAHRPSVHNPTTFDPIDHHLSSSQSFFHQTGLQPRPTSPNSVSRPRSLQTSSPAKKNSSNPLAFHLQFLNLTDQQVPCTNLSPTTHPCRPPNRRSHIHTNQPTLPRTRNRATTPAALPSTTRP